MFEVGDLQVAVVHESLGVLRHASAHAVKRHDNVCRVREGQTLVIRSGTHGDRPRETTFFSGPLRLRATAADRTRAGTRTETDPDCATDSDCTALLTADLDVIRMFTSLSAAYYTKNLFICGRFSHPRFSRNQPGTVPVKIPLTVSHRPYHKGQSLKHSYDYNQRSAK